jgi:diguanylate cyclase (GGDEF)-like protein
LDSDLVSRHHATFRCVGDETELQDHGSTNGTFVNDKSITASTLSDGARIGVGEFVLKYLAPGNAEARYHDEMFRLMSHDGLTDVFNKRYWEEQIGGLVKRANETFCLIILDADHFKRVNDSYGHAAGDAVLRQIAKCARSAISGSERALLARLGGEEFGVILPGMALQAAADQAERIRKVVDDHAFSFGARPIDVTVSLGVAVWEAESGGSAQDVYKRADAQLYRAKQQGRNRVCR